MRIPLENGHVEIVRSTLYVTARVVRTQAFNQRTTEMMLVLTPAEAEAFADGLARVAKVPAT